MNVNQLRPGKRRITSSLAQWRSEWKQKLSASFVPLW